MISYTITACTEEKELRVLLQFLKKNITPNDEVVLQLDAGGVTREVKEVAQSYVGQLLNYRIVEHPLNRDFAQFKNNLKLNCTKGWIFNIDADELPSVDLVQNMHQIIQMNEEIDVFILPRWNTVDGITEDHINRWGWKYDELGRINFPDWQMRLYRNHPRINWINKVHERLEGFDKYTFLPTEREYCLFHNKTIDKQEKQNQLYNSMG